jgi:hypothetical protein
MSSSPGYEKEKEREGKERDSREDEVRNSNETEVCMEGKEELRLNGVLRSDDGLFDCLLISLTLSYRFLLSSYEFIRRGERKSAIIVEELVTLPKRCVLLLVL